MRGMGIFAAGILAGCAGLYGVSFWEESGAVVDETVADAPSVAARLMPLGSQIPFRQFRYPHVDTLENVTFIVDQEEHHGIYRSFAVNRNLSKVVESGATPLPTAGAVVDYIRGLQIDGDDFVFNATDSLGGRGLYFWRAGMLETIARTQETVLPGDSLVLKDVEYGSLSAGNVLFTAETPVGIALVLHDVVQRANRVLLRTGVQIPNRDVNFEYFSPQNWMDGGDVVFRAARVSDPHRKRNEKYGVRGIYGWFGQLPGSPHAFALEDLRTIADWSTPIPGMNGRLFTDFRSAPVRHGLVAFVGSGDGCEGVYLYNANAVNKTLRVIVDTETQIPSLFAGPLTDFGIFPTICGDAVVFAARAGGGFAGVFLYNVTTDTLFVLADNRSPIGGKAVSGFEIAGQFLVRNRFAITATFKDGTSGVYLATIPVEGFTRMGAPGL